MKKKPRPGIDEAALTPYMAEIRTHIDENRLLDSLVEELAVQKLAMQELRQSIAAMKALLRARDLILPEVKMRYAGTRAVKIDAGMPMSAEMGFYALEIDAQGQAYRWTGPEPSFFFDLHLDRTAPLKFSLHLSEVHKAASSNLRCLTEGKEIFLIKHANRSTLEFTGQLQPRESIGVTRLEFVVERSFKPDNEKRTLGAAFQKLEVAPADEAEVQEYLQISGVS